MVGQDKVLNCVSNRHQRGFILGYSCGYWAGKFYKHMNVSNLLLMILGLKSVIDGHELGVLEQGDNGNSS